MTDRELILRILEIGVDTFLSNRSGFADPSKDSALSKIGVATIAAWLEELGKLRLIGRVEPRFGAGTGLLVYQVTDEAVTLWNQKDELEHRIKHLLPHALPAYDIFLSYTHEDSHIANELKEILETSGLRCFMAEKDIAVGMEWADQIRSALHSSKRILLLITPRSKNRPWL